MALGDECDGQHDMQPPSARRRKGSGIPRVAIVPSHALNDLGDGSMERQGEREVAGGGVECCKSRRR
jgi:hypothetical protein